MHAVHAAALGPFLAGQDTVAGTSAFMLYAIISNPEIYARVQTEVDALFANGIPAATDFRNAEALHNTAVETMRRYPVAPFMPQHISQDFEYSGYRMEKGEPIYVAQTITHFLPEFFEDPFTFNIDRPKPKAQTYAPFGVGPHTCIGAGMGELQIMVHIASLLHQAKYELAQPNYILKTKTLPPAPANFRLKIIEKRIK
jgi:cytochrome P450